MKCSRGVISVDVEGTQTNIVLVTTKKANISSTAFISRLDSVFSIVKIISSTGCKSFVQTVALLGNIIWRGS